MPSANTCVRGHQWDSETSQCPVCGAERDPKVRWPPDAVGSTTSDPRFEEAVLSYLKAVDAGQVPSTADFLARYPGLEKELLGFLADQQHIAPLVMPLRQDTPAESAGLLSGQCFGDYEVLIELGRGGMGVVHHARHRATGRLVALKVLRDALLDSPQQRSRFRTEAEALTRLRHPNVVGLIEAGEQDGRPYFVMELVTGGSLDRRLAGKPQPPREAAEMVETLARAVAFAHEQGIVHRDLKPGNILLAEDGTLKLNDFGLARQLDADTRQTSTGAVLGTPRYMSPEQAEGRPERIGPATDVWALGVILYEMLTGRTPFTGSSYLETLEQIRTAEPEPPSRLQTDLPRDLETICLKCLHKEPGRRYPSAPDLAEDLRRFREDRPIKARRVGLRERAVKWRRRNPVTATLVATAALLVLAGSAPGLWYWNAYQREKVEYFAACTSQDGVKRGVVPLSAMAARQRDVSYKFYRRGRHVVRVEIVNSRGELTRAPERTAQLRREHDQTLGSADEQECRFEYTRTEKGKLLEETAYDRNGNVLWALRYDSANTAHYTTRRARGTGFGGGVEGLPQSRARSGATYLVFTWTAKGHEAEVHYLDRAGDSPTPDDGHVYGKRQEYDSEGLVVRVTWLDAEGRPVRHSRTGVATTTFGYDERGNRIEERYFDARGKPCLDVDRTHGLTARYDERGNRIEECYIDVARRPCLHRKGYHRITLRVDGRGNRVEEACFDVQGRPCLNWVGFHRIFARHDERGNTIEETLFASDGRPCLHRKGFHKATYRYDESGNRVEEACLGVDGRPCFNRNGFSRLARRFDDRGNAIEEAYFDVQGRPCLHRLGFHKAVGRYDQRGNRSEEGYFDVDERPCLHKEGVHTFTFVVDERGNRIELSCFGVDGQPCLHNNSFHKVRGRYDDRGNQIEATYFGKDGRPCSHREGFHRFIARYDERRQRIEEATFDVDQRPCLHNNGFHKATRRFDDCGNLTAEAYFDRQGQPCPHIDAYHRFLARYDVRGNRVEEAWFDVNDRPCLHRGGGHKIMVRYDERGNSIEEAFFGIDQKPCQRTDGFHKGKFRYDERGNRVEEAYFWVEDRPCLHNNGFHKVTFRYDERDHPIEETVFDRAGRPCLAQAGYHKLVARYDERGKRSEITSFSTRGRKLVRRAYDEQGKVLRTTLFFYQDAQTIELLGEAVASIARTTDDKGRLCEETYHGSNGKLVRNRHGQARVTIAYDDKSAPLSRSYFDESGKPLATRVVVQKVLPDTQAERLKLQVGDILVSYDGRPLNQVMDLPTWPAGNARKDNRSRLLVILRKGETITVKVAAEPLGVNLADVAVGAAR
jgi:YD repeat-containing protein